ncbi:unnamed protein product [Ectocarpus sp. CCAP 1310/34]|nr:unnamed protein product [Ectocarpus sp. CCAP 1310/34]
MFIPRHLCDRTQNAAELHTAVTPTAP